MVTKSLLENSESYYNKNSYYETFSLAEDYENKVRDYLRPIIKNKIVLDAGCGTGKYLEMFQQDAKFLYGIDVSDEQLKLANQKIINDKKVKLICADLSMIPLENEEVDVIYATWAISTIADLAKRKIILNELVRVLKPNGSIILIDNDTNGAFEEIRGRTKDNRTQDNNMWFLNNGFKVINKIKTSFKFKNKKEANQTFYEIYGEEVANKIKSNYIDHNIIIFEYKKIDI